MMFVKPDLVFVWRRPFSAYIGFELSFVYLVFHAATCLFKGFAVIC